MNQTKTRMYKKHKITVVESGLGYNITICSPIGEQVYFGQNREDAASPGEAIAEAMDIVDNILSRQPQGVSRKE